MSQRENGEWPALLLATGNRYKVEEMTSILTEILDEKYQGGFGRLTLHSLHDFPDLDLPPETGGTYRENAEIKACAAARATGHIALADDSGLEIDALSGAPGIQSARWMEGVSQKEKNQRILDLLKDQPMENQTARFRCVAAVCQPHMGRDLIVRTFEGILEGFIAKRASGAGGFGYDPIFLPAEAQRPGEHSLAELEPEEKNRISHRALALKKAADHLGIILNDP